MKYQPPGLNISGASLAFAKAISDAAKACGLALIGFAAPEILEPVDVSIVASVKNRL